MALLCAVRLLLAVALLCLLMITWLLLTANVFFAVLLLDPLTCNVYVELTSCFVLAGFFLWD